MKLARKFSKIKRRISLRNQQPHPSVIAWNENASQLDKNIDDLDPNRTLGEFGFDSENEDEVEYFNSKK